MMQVWIGTALLAGSWLLGLNYFAPASPLAWLASVIAGVVLLGRGMDHLVRREGEESIRSHELRSWLGPVVVILLLLPAVGFASWPYRAAPLLLVLGLALRLVLRSPSAPLRQASEGSCETTSSGWPQRLANGAIAAGVILLVQWLALKAYASQTARSHELPWPLPDLLAAIAGLLGIDAVADGSNVALHSMRQLHRLGATWELLLDPATLCFFAGGLAMLAMAAWDNLPPGRRGRAWMRGAGALPLTVLAWLPVRAGLLMAVYLHRLLRSDAEQPLHVMNHFFSPWALILLLIAPVLLAWRFVRISGPADADTTPLGPVPPEAEPKSRFARRVLARQLPLPVCAGLVGLGVALLTAAVAWNPVGARKEGRVMIVERHSTWEPTTKPYDTSSYGELAGYNYAAIYDYLGQYFQMSRLLEADKIDDDTLRRCDVLVIKTPTERYDEAEVATVRRFVEQGGSLLLIGDHTNFYGSSTVMNDITRPLGFTFRNDLLFSFEESPYDELYARPAVSHPAVQHVPWMDFAVSCSIDPGHSRGRAVIVGTRLWSMGPDYHVENFHPIPQHCPEMRYGAFVQVWAAWFGKGRALAFTDSTIFSNFCVFQPGKAELMRDMVEWLNHANPPCDPRPWLVLAGLPLLAAGVWFACGRDRSWLVLLAAGMFGWTAASLAVNILHAWAMPLPKCERPQVRVVIDRTTSSVPLSKGAYITGDGAGYGLLEQWIPRLGYYTVRKEGDEAFSGDVLVAICPSGSVSQQYRERLIQYVAGGGKLVVIDSPENTRSSANSLLWPFGLSVHHDRAWQGKLALVGQSTDVKIERTWEVEGGQPEARLDKLPIAAAARHGKGAVLAIGFGSLWNDVNMGENWMLEPQPAVKARYEVLYGLLRSFVEEKPRKPSEKVLLPPTDVPAESPAKAPVETPATRPEARDLPMKESGPAEL